MFIVIYIKVFLIFKYNLDCEEYDYNPMDGMVIGRRGLKLKVEITGNREACGKLCDAQLPENVCGSFDYCMDTQHCTLFGKVLSGSEDVNPFITDRCLSYYKKCKKKRKCMEM